MVMAGCVVVPTATVSAGAAGSLPPVQATSMTIKARQVTKPKRKTRAIIACIKALAPFEHCNSPGDQSNYRLSEITRRGHLEHLSGSALHPSGHSCREAELPTDGRFISPGGVGTALLHHPLQPATRPRPTQTNQPVSEGHRWTCHREPSEYDRELYRQRKPV